MIIEKNNKNKYLSNNITLIKINKFHQGSASHNRINHQTK